MVDIFAKIWENIKQLNGMFRNLWKIETASCVKIVFTWNIKIG